MILERLGPDVLIGGARFDFAGRQSYYLAAGLVIAGGLGPVTAIWSPLRRYKYTLLLAGIGLLLATFAFGTPIAGARIWINAGPILIQPSEPIKILLVLFLAAYLDDKRDLLTAGWQVGPLNLPPLPYVIPMGIMAGTSVLVLVVENDLGSALMLFAAFLTMLYVATGRRSLLLIGFAGFGGAAWLAYSLFDRIGIRVQNWLDPWRDPLDAGYQQIQSDYALGNSGVLGRGLGHGQPWRIPAVQTDYVYSAIGEELGFLGATAVLLLLALLVIRGVRIALRAENDYARLVAVGLAATLGVQTVIIVSGVVRMLPLTGITLPFVSYGGSSLLTNFLLLALLLNLSARPFAARDAP